MPGHIASVRSYGYRWLPPWRTRSLFILARPPVLLKAVKARAERRGVAYQYRRFLREPLERDPALNRLHPPGRQRAQNSEMNGNLARFAVTGLLLALATVVVGQSAPRYWLAGTYDAEHMVVIFGQTDGIHPPADSMPILPAMTRGLGFLGDMAFVPATDAGAYLAKLAPGQPTLGQTLDLLPGWGYLPIPIKLRRYVTWSAPGEGQGFFGAIASVPSRRFDPYPVLSFPSGLCLATLRDRSAESVRRTPPQPRLAPAPPELRVTRNVARVFIAGIPPMPAPYCSGCMDRHAIWVWIEAHPEAVRMQVQLLRLADGSVRDFVRAQWDLPDHLVPGWEPKHFSVTGWVAPMPAMHVVRYRSSYGNEFLDLSSQAKIENVVAASGGQTAIIFSVPTLDGGGVSVVEYSDHGKPLVLISVGTSA